MADSPKTARLPKREKDGLGPVNWSCSSSNSPALWEGEVRASVGHPSRRTLGVGGSLLPALNNEIIGGPLMEHRSVLSRVVIILQRKKWENRGLEKSTHFPGVWR